ncbi:molybdopterin-guanine dinucleotide biosynthesis protein B [Methanobrevibacter filiformis]|uniref:Molybdopterin-guanine dinucleotide biosynthesis adapter protein n=1 Tax=Methanobrevibacter filiformis TaxID=55758 RepID=A0A166F8Q7_9EURY|nr:molybdopterin-guanine dinucleotide biosynthesis protein B [Methanobrevibacter filiformis]KZX17423.1 molybdopterin-guanine dinucleotide biosynthesis adapter protein [Methanobrevibacter filiformis]
MFLYTLKYGGILIRIISIVGKKNTGKTSLTVKVIEELNNRGFKVGSIKHSHHKMDIDHKGKDTYLHKEAGSKLVVGMGDTAFFNIQKEIPLERLLFLMKIIEEPDFVVIEGFKNYNYSKISTSPEINDEYVIEQVDVFNLDDNDIIDIVDNIEKHSHDITNTLYTNECGYSDGESIGKAITKGEIAIDPNEFEVNLAINEKVIGLNYFVNQFLKNSIIGMLKTLKTKKFGVNDFDKIEILIQNKEK